VTPRLTANDPEILLGAALAGVGITLLPEFVCVQDIQAKRLRHVLPQWGSAAMPVHALYPTARLLSPAVSAFIALVRKRFTLSA